MLLVGLTGGIGSGKTICCQIFEALDVPVYYSDHAAKRLMVENAEVRSAIIDHFGLASYDDDGLLNRAHLASVIFADKEQLEKMNSIVHPAVRKDFFEWTTMQKDEKYIIQESALLIETGSYKFFDKIILVHAPEDLRIDRVMLRDKVSQEEVKARMSKQMSQEEKLEFSDFVLLNDGKKSIVRQVLQVHTDILCSLPAL